MLSENKRLGLSLSGGGFRATAFHLGTLKKLYELGILSKVDVLSTISGGSILGAAWCLHKGDFNSFFEEMSFSLKSKSVIKFVLTSSKFVVAVLLIFIFLVLSLLLLFTSWAPLFIVVLSFFIFILAKFQFQLLPVSKEVERAYNNFFYQGKTLNDLNTVPVLAIGSSNLHTGRPFTFSKLKMSDSTYEYFQPPVIFLPKEFPVARAVTASTCVPFAFTPVSIAEEFFAEKADYKKVRPQLIDGGVYDNQGIQKLTQRGSSYECDIIITSDAGGGFMADVTYNNTIGLLVRTVDMFMHRIKTMQMVNNIYHNVESGNKPIAYLSLGWQLENCIPGFVRNMIKGLVPEEVINAHSFDSEWIAEPEKFKSRIQEYLEEQTDYANIKARDLTEKEWQSSRTISTNLISLSAKQLDCLIRHAENLTELQVKLYCPTLLHSHVL